MIDEIHMLVDTYQFENNFVNRGESGTSAIPTGMKAVHVPIGSDIDDFLYHVSIEKG